MWCIIIGILFCTIKVSSNISTYEIHNANTNYTVLQTTLPHDVYPGFEVFNLKLKGSSQLLETGFNKFFSLLSNGVLMTTADLGALVEIPVKLLILEENSVNRSGHVYELLIQVIDRNKILRIFNENLGEGSIEENAVSGTPINGLLEIRVCGNFPVHVNLLQEDDGSRPFAFLMSDTKEIKFNLTLLHPEINLRLVTTEPLDSEYKSLRKVRIEVFDFRFITQVKIEGLIHILNLNDNRPVFDRKEYCFIVRPENSSELVQNNKNNIQWKRFSVLGKVHATDADGDILSYYLLTPNEYVIVIPQTGDVLLVNGPNLTNKSNYEVEVLIQAHDLHPSSLTSSSPAKVTIRFLTSIETQNNLYEYTNQFSNSTEITFSPNHRIYKRRITRAVRPTKRIEFTEADGDIEGKIIFHLEKENERETYKIRDDNKWITVGSNGTIRVKQKWDYEELGPDKAIDFWVTITNSG